jgi:hypothetical protein
MMGSRGYADAVTVPPKRALPTHVPATVRGAGLIVAVQGAAGLVVAGVLVLRGLQGADQRVVNGFGTAIWFFLVGGGVLVAGYALLVGKRWGRGVAVFTQLLLLPVAWYLAVGSHQLVFGIAVAIVALSAFGLLFSPAAVRWAACGGQRGTAGSASREPDSR